MENPGLPDAGTGEKAKDGGSVRAYCKECRHFAYCLERTRDIPCADYKERRKDGRDKDHFRGTHERRRVCEAEEEKKKPKRVSDIEIALGVSVGLNVFFMFWTYILMP